MDFAVVDMMTIFAIFKYVKFLHLPSCFFRHPTQNLYLITEYPNENFTSTWLIQCFDKNQNLLVHNESSQGHGQKKNGANCSSYQVFLFLWNDTLKLSIFFSHYFFCSQWVFMSTCEDKESMESRLLIALIVLRNSAFWHCDRNFWICMKTQKVWCQNF